MSRPARVSRRTVLAGLAAAATSACVPVSSPPLRCVPPGLGSEGPLPPLIFIHGSFGSRLRRRRDGHEVWPGSKTELLLGTFDDLEVPIGPGSALQGPDDIEAYRLFERAGAIQFYGSAIQMLSEAAGYVPSVPGTPVESACRRQYVLLFDWRRDFASAAAQLGALIEAIRRDHGDPTLKVDLVTHSSGGLVARWFLLYGATPLPAPGLPMVTYAGAPQVRRIVAIGSPRLGMARVAAALAQGEPVGLNRVRAQVLASCDSVLELLPQAYDTWLLDENGAPLERDAFDVETWRELGTSIFDPGVRKLIVAQQGGGAQGREYLALAERSLALRLGHARRFSEALWQAPRPLAVPQVVIGGNCRPTQARLLVEREGERRVLRVLPQDIRRPRRGLDYDRLMLEPGDGMVTGASLLARPAWPTPVSAASLEPQIRYSRWVCTEHNQLFANPECQAALLEALLVSDDELPRINPAAAGG